MQFIAHRINTLEELKALPESIGVEIDIRDFGKELVLAHDPFTGGELFENYLPHVKNRMMILNIKSERIEPKILELLTPYPSSDFFFLDSSFPMMVSLIQKGEPRFAARFSEFESIETILNLKNKVNWVWIDCFTTCPLSAATAQRLQNANFKLCIVSPDLLGRPEEISKYANLLLTQDIKVDAICTKLNRIEEWKHALQLD